MVGSREVVALLSLLSLFDVDGKGFITPEDMKEFDKKKKKRRGVKVRSEYGYESISSSSTPSISVSKKKGREREARSSPPPSHLLFPHHHFLFPLLKRRWVSLGGL